MHTSDVAADEVTTRDGLPVTTVLRTISDVARAGMASEHVARAISQALERGMVSEDELRAEADRRGGRFAKAVGGVLAERGRL